MSNINLNIAAIPGVQEINDGAAEKCSGGIKPDVVLYEDVNFKGKKRNVWGSTRNVGRVFNDKTSSLVINRGRWQLYDDSNYRGERSNVLGPGRYRWIEEDGLRNDVLTSLRKE